MINLMKIYRNHEKNKQSLKHIIKLYRRIYRSHKHSSAKFIQNRNKSTAKSTYLSQFDISHLYLDYAQGMKPGSIKRKYHIGDNHYRHIVNVLIHRAIRDERDSNTPAEYLSLISHSLTKMPANCVSNNYYYIKEHIEYLLNHIVENPHGENKNVHRDVLLPRIIKELRNKTHISTSKLQRMYCIGYNRAANIMDYLTKRHYVSCINGSKPRRVLIGRKGDIKDTRATVSSKSHKNTVNGNISKFEKAHLPEYCLINYNSYALSHILFKEVRGEKVPSGYLSSYPLIRTNSYIISHMASVIFAFAKKAHKYNLTNWSKISVPQMKSLLNEYKQSVYTAIELLYYSNMPIAQISRYEHLTPSSISNYVEMPHIYVPLRHKIRRFSNHTKRTKQLSLKAI